MAEQALQPRQPNLASSSYEEKTTREEKQCLIRSLHRRSIRAHEPSPRPGKQIHRDTVSYFLVLTIRPDRTAEPVDIAVQTDDVQPALHEPQSLPPDRPLLYAALLGSKAEATEAIKGLLAKINDDHGSLPHTL